MAVRRGIAVLPVYERHEESSAQGDMEDWEAGIARLAKSIKEDGLLEKITLSEDGDTVLDGWHRYNALLLIHPKGIPAHKKEEYFTVYDPEENGGLEEADFSYHKNANRRQQTLLQRIEAAAHYLGIDPHTRGSGVKIAAELGIDPSAVSRALKAPEQKAPAPKVKSIAKKKKPTDPMEALEFRREELEEKREKLEEQLDELEEQLDEVDSQIKELKGDFDE